MVPGQRRALSLPVKLVAVKDFHKTPAGQAKSLDLLFQPMTGTNTKFIAWRQLTENKIPYEHIVNQRNIQGR
jgi:hypothetical protein